MKRFYKSLLATVLMLMVAVSAKAIGWPANYEGVMLQSFWWDSYQESTAKPYKATTWSNLEAQADELSQYFKLIWVPNSGKSTGGLGYMPIYWFTNHNSSMGNETSLKSMIQTYKEKGVGIIADVVINHRAGRTNWTDFPAETWNGTTYQIGLDGICRTDEVNRPGNPGGATGAPDEGEDFDGARDLDHTNANVQLNCKNYCKCLLEKYGYVGFRLDMVKGYSGYYTKMYNQYSKPTYSVGEYWDGSYDALTAWIESTGRESAAFDFAFKYRVNEAFHSGNYAELAWQAPDGGKQPAGLIHYGYQQLAVTFIDNHDTYRDGSKFNGDVVAANAFMLCSPGTPCVFMPHYNQYKSAIQKLINIRNSCGITNTSRVNVLVSNSGCYMAEVYGNKGTLVVKIGPNMESPQGYSNSDIKASGNLYCVWTKASVNVGGGGGDNPTPTGELYMIGHVNGTSWGTNTSLAPSSSSNNVYTWNNVTINKSSDTDYGYFSFVTARGADWDEVNSYDRYGAATADEVLNGSATIVKYPVGVSASAALSWAVTPGNYKVVADLNTMKVTISATSGGDDPVITPPTPGGDFTVYFRNNVAWNVPWIHYWGGTSESTWPGVAMTKHSGDVWKYTVPAGTTGIIFHPDDNDTWKTADLTAVPNHIYEFGSTSGQGKDCGVYDGAGGNTGGDDPVTPPTPGEYPAKVYVVGNLNGLAWASAHGILPNKTDNGVYTWNSLTFVNCDSTDPASPAYFTFLTALDAVDGEWDGANQSDRYGAPTADAPLAVGTTSPVRLYANQVDAMGAQSWKIEPGTYDLVLNLRDMTVLANRPTSIEAVISNNDAEAEYFTLQGLRVARPTESGFYIMRQGNKVTKIFVR